MPPTFLIDSLNGVRRKVKALSVAFGVGVVLACAVGALLGTVLIDYLLNLHAVPRLVVAAAALFGLGYASVRWIVRPVLARLSLSDVAGHLETVFPEFDDRLRSTVDFVQQPADSIPGSEMMKDRVVSEATTLVQNTDLSRAVITTPVWYSLAGAVGALALLIAISILLPPFIKIGLPRLFSPFANNPWPKSVLIDAAALPSRVPVGQRVELSLALKKGDRPSQKAMVFYQYDNGPIQKEYMIRGANGRYTAAIDARPGTEKLTVWMASGDDETDHKVIQVVPRLAIQGVQAIVTAPAYAQMPPTTVDLSKAPAFMVTGSKVALHVQFNKPLDPNKPIAFNVLSNGDNNNKPTADPGITTDRAAPAAPIGNWVAKDSFRFRIVATDLDGFENTGLEEYEVIVKPDQLPTVVIESPKKTIDRTPDAYLPLQILAEDDFGIASLRLIVDRVATAAPDPKDPNPAPASGVKHWELPLNNWARIDGTGERQRFRLNWDWELKATLGNLKPGDVLEYFVEAKDNYQFESTENGKTVILYHPPQFSGKLRVNILSEDELKTQQTDAIRQIATQTKSVETSQNSNQAETKNLQQDTKDKPELSKGDKSALDNAISRESTINSQTNSLANKLDDVQKDLKENRVKDPELNDIAKEAKQDLEQAAAKPMTDAANDLNRAAQAKTNSLDPQQQQKTKDARNQALEQSQENQAAAAKKLNDAIKKMDQVGTMSDTIKKWDEFDKTQKELQKELKEIAKETLGKTPTPEQQEKLKKNADEQKKLADKIDEATKQMEKMGQQMSKSDPQSAEAMKQAADQAKSQQITPQQRQAADQAQKNQQAQAQNAQQQAELGIQVVLNTLKDAERRKLEQLVKLLDKAVEDITDLVRRQAGHNIDNLDLQGAEVKAKAMTKEELDVLYVKAKRDQKPGPKVELSVITSGQEMTERNTRSVAKVVEEEIKEGGAIIAQDLVRAAGKMGYAIVDLRDKKLATAYNPHQVEALNALDQALKKAQDALDQAKKKSDANKQEAIKARLEKVRLEQTEKVNKPTGEIDKSRKADGTMPREDAVRLGQLPGAQGELSKTMLEIADSLRELGGVIYNDAAKEVASGMDEVKEDLGKQKTGQTTQLEQARIIEQLDAMIDSLKQEIDKSKFDQKGGGGGGGGGKSKLPSEVELRLLRALQTAVNKNTINAAKLPKEQQDKVALVNLGTRQGKLRTLLDNLLKQATQGKEGLKPEPDPKDKLPEEANKEQIENQEIEKELLDGDAQGQKETKQLNRVGDRMARSRQRLALDGDPGEVTQEIQKRIIIDISDMIKQAQQQQANSKPKPGDKPGEPKPGQQPGQQQAGNQSQPNNAQNAAQQSTVNGGGSRDASLGPKLDERNKEWGAISPRLRQAVIDGTSESIAPKYKKLVEDYYRGVSTSGKQP